MPRPRDVAYLCRSLFRPPLFCLLVGGPKLGTELSQLDISAIAEETFEILPSGQQFQPKLFNAITFTDQCPPSLELLFLA